MLNEELVLKIADQFREHPESWYQGTYWQDKRGCGSSGCIVGWAVFMADKKAHARLERGNGNWDVHAAKALGIPVTTANYLSGGNRGPAGDLTVYEALEKWAAGTPLVEVWE